MDGIKSTLRCCTANFTAAVNQREKLKHSLGLVKSRVRKSSDWGPAVDTPPGK